jgi:polar amino acid transport system permease protein
MSIDSLLTPANIAVLARGLGMTAAITAASWCLAMGLGVVLAALHESCGRAVKGAVLAFVAWQRNIPALAHLLLWYFGVPALLPKPMQSWINAHNGEAVFSIVAIGLCVAAYFCEDLRSGFRSIPHTQNEAARALGLGSLQAMRFVLVPQALRIALPALVNHTVLLFKTTSLAMAIGVVELTYVMRELETQTFRTFEAYSIVTVVYLLISLGLMGAGASLARRTRIPAR